MKGDSGMGCKKVSMGSRKKIALVAHDNQKQDLFEWAKFNIDVLAQHDLYATGTTGTILGEELDLEIAELESGPLGRPADRGKNLRRGDRLCDLFLGFVGAATTRSRR
jgi:methylglyoxal synthase